MDHQIEISLSDWQLVGVHQRFAVGLVNPRVVDQQRAIGKFAGHGHPMRAGYPVHDMLVNQHQCHMPAIQPPRDIRCGERRDIDGNAYFPRLSRKMLLYVA